MLLKLEAGKQYKQQEAENDQVHIERVCIDYISHMWAQSLM
jgi:hypothetical protein